jgi:hypothetical protein
MYQILRDGLANAGNFAKASFTKPDNFPLHLTWIATVGLAAFAYYAWQESQRGTRAMESQIGALQLQTEMSERPWLINHVLVTGPLKTMVANNERPSIEITLRVENIGHSPAIQTWVAGELFLESARSQRLIPLTQVPLYVVSEAGRA